MLVTMGGWVCWLVILILGSAVASRHGTINKNMNDFLQVLEYIEKKNPTLTPLDVLRNLRLMVGLDDPYIQHYLGNLTSMDFPRARRLDARRVQYLSTVVNHVLHDSQEDGVVFCGDGTTVALMPLLFGLESGLVTSNKASFVNMYPVIFDKDLGLNLLQYHNSLDKLGVEGVWNSLDSPQTYTLNMWSAAEFTDAYVNGGLDGALLGEALTKRARRPARLSTLLRQYYLYTLNGSSIDEMPPLISVLRRQNTPTTNAKNVAQQMMKALKVYWAMHHMLPVRGVQDIITIGVKYIFKTFVACPKIISRSTWMAAPYKGSPVGLTPPLPYWIIHHSVQPNVSCMSFEDCAADMRAMQYTDQNVGGYRDIKFNFLVGGDGYIYEGCGWDKVGFHTKGYNYKSYGICFMGDFTDELPADRLTALVRDLSSFAVTTGRLSPSYEVKGHRQLVRGTTCPGKMLYNSIKQWPHWRA